MINELILQTGVDIPFPQAQAVIHQPTMEEIGYIGGEENFFSGYNLLTFSKNRLSDEDKTHLEGLSDFEVLMSIINTDDEAIKQQKEYFSNFLFLIFPDYKVNLMQDRIYLIKADSEGKIESTGVIDKDNFNNLKEIIVEMFDFKQNDSLEEYVPQGDYAKMIVEKLKERHRKLAEMKKGNANKVAILSRYISILSVGLKKDKNSFNHYTVYQLFDEFQRYELKQHFDYYVKAQMAGAKDLGEVDDWMKDLHP